MSHTALLHAYDTQLRTRIPQRIPAGTTMERVGPLLRVAGMACGLIEPPVDVGVRGAQVSAMIQTQRDFFARRGEPVEWKLRGHDQPTDLPARLVEAGFVPHAPETVVIGTTSQLTRDVPIPTDVTIRSTTSGADMGRIAAFESEVWGEDRSSLADDLRARVSGLGDDYVVLIAESDQKIVAAAWLEIETGTEFAGLWGGATAAAWRGKGIYRALVARRAQLAGPRGVKYLQVDASPDSRPILERLGFVSVTTTTPYVWTPPA